jgi:cytochrome c oxidase assembly protein Cox11
MRDEIMEVKKEIEEVKEKSFALELVSDYKKQNKRQFIIILVILTMWFASIGLFIYYINTTGYEVTTETAETNDSGNACVGDNCNNGVVNGKGN